MEQTTIHATPETTQTATIQTPTVPQVSQPTAALMTTLMALIDNYIRDLVTSQVNEILMSHRTLRVIDDGFTEKIKEIATAVVEGAIEEHNDEMYHISEDSINDIATTAIEDHDFDSQINDAINDFDFTDVITASIKDNITFTATINVD